MFNLTSKILCAAIAIAASSITNSAWAASLNFTTTSPTVHVGNTVVVNVVVSDLLNNQDLSAFDFNINYNPSVLSLSSYTLGNGLGDLSVFDAIDTSGSSINSGKYNLSEVSFLSDLSSQSSTFSLATLTFNVLASGNSTLNFSDVILGDANGSQLTTVSLGTLQISASVAAIPEPETYALMIAGLGLLRVLRRQRQS